MTELCLPPGPDYAPPGFALPALATDCHMHLFAPSRHTNYVAERDYTPARADADDARALYRTLGIARFVVIQPSVFGTDNTCQLETAAGVGLPYRAVVVIPADAAEREMTRLHDQGVRGIRYILAHPGGLDIAGLERSADRARDFGWHIEFLLKPAQLLALAPRLARLSCPFSCDHLALIDPAAGPEQPAFQTLLHLLQDGRAWAKLSGAYRVSRRMEAYGPVVPYARRLVEARPDRILWGSDWPHVGHADAVPKTTPLLDFLAEVVPEPDIRARILVDNADAFYGF